jgi:hypothetical protein
MRLPTRGRTRILMLCGRRGLFDHRLRGGVGFHRSKCLLLARPLLTESIGWRHARKVRCANSLTEPSIWHVSCASSAFLPRTNCARSLFSLSSSFVKRCITSSFLIPHTKVKPMLSVCMRVCVPLHTRAFITRSTRAQLSSLQDMYTCLTLTALHSHISFSHVLKTKLSKVLRIWLAGAPRQEEVL